jgi:hypothetical protein
MGLKEDDADDLLSTAQGGADVRKPLLIALGVIIVAIVLVTAFL